MILIAIEATILLLLLLLLEARLSHTPFVAYLKRDPRRLFALPLIVWVPLGFIQLLVLLEERADEQLVLRHYFLVTGVLTALALLGFLLPAKRTKLH
jgi:hypothetical protein